MKNRTTHILTLSAAAIISAVLLTACGFNSGKLHYTQYANGSSGESWKYEMSNDDVLREASYSKKQFFLNLGSGYRQEWEFEAMGQGEVTIVWTKLKGGRETSESYYEIYSVDENNKVTKISDSRSTEE